MRPPPNLIRISGVPLLVLIRWVVRKECKLPLGHWPDLGTGTGDFVASLQLPAVEAVGVDILESAGGLPPNFRYESKDLTDWMKEHAAERFDLITLFEVVEHFQKDEALELLNRVNKMANNILISTPRGFLKQDGETDENLKAIPPQWHRSGFEIEDFLRLGFFVVIQKRFHTRGDLIFDSLVAYKNTAGDYRGLRSYLWRHSFLYNLHPLHAFRTLRQFFRTWTKTNPSEK